MNAYTRNSVIVICRFYPGCFFSSPGRFFGKLYARGVKSTPSSMGTGNTDKTGYTCFHQFLVQFLSYRVIYHNNFPLAFARLISSAFSTYKKDSFRPFSSVLAHLPYPVTMYSFAYGSVIVSFAFYLKSFKQNSSRWFSTPKLFNVS